jgi:hypothetical protein
MIGDDGQILVESGAIVEYILERYGNGRLVPPRGTPEYTRYVQWMHFSEGMAMSGLMNEALLRMSGAGTERAPVLGSLRRRNDRMMDYINDELGKSRYFAGDAFSAADIMMTFIFPVYIRFLQRPWHRIPMLCSTCIESRADRLTNARCHAPIRMGRTGDSQLTLACAVAPGRAHDMRLGHERNLRHAVYLDCGRRFAKCQGQAVKRLLRSGQRLFDRKSIEMREYVAYARHHAVIEGVKLRIAQVLARQIALFLRFERPPS